MIQGDLLKVLRQVAESELDWQSEALCAQTDPEAFFPDLHAQARQAIRVCQKCPVIKQCHNYAVVTQQEHGVWGGKDFTIRRNVKGVKYRRESVKLI